MDFLTEGDEDDDFLTPQKGKTHKTKQTSHVGLLSLFNSSNNSSQKVGGNDPKNDFTYKPPKKNQDSGSKDSDSGNISNPKTPNPVFVVDVFLFDSTASNGGNTGYKPLGKSGVTVIDKPGGTPKERSSTSNQKVLVLYRSKQETLAAAPIIGGKFIFDIQNETYGCFYTLGKTQQKITWSLCFKDHEELLNFARIIALSKLATINKDEQRTKGPECDPICTQILAKPQVSNDSNAFGITQFGHFSVDMWTIHDENFTYHTRLEEEQIHKVSGGGDEGTPFWTKFMIGANAGERRVVIMPNNDQYVQNSKNESLASQFVAFEVKLMKILPPNQTKMSSGIKTESRNVDSKDDSIPKIKSEMHNNRFKTQELSRDEKDIIEPDSAQNENGANKAFLGKLNQAISNANQEKSGRVDSANNLESVASTSRLDLILTEQRIHHLAMLKLDEKLDKILANKTENCSKHTAEPQSSSDDNTQALVSLQNELQLANTNNDELQAQLEEANNKFLRLETLLQTTEGELAAVKEDLVNLSNSKSEEVSKEFDPEATNKMVKRVLNKIFKQMKGKFSDDEESNKSYSGQDIVDALAQQFRDVAQLLNSSSEQNKTE